MPSITATLKETFFLCMQKFWYLVVIFLLTDVPYFYLERMVTPRLPKHSHGDWSLLGIILQFVLRVFEVAAILGLLSKKEPKSDWLAICLAIKKYFWILFKVVFLAMGLFVLGLIPARIVLWVFGSYASTWSYGLYMLLLVFCLVYLVTKLGLIYPIAVTNERSARGVIKRSWQMTRGYSFWYVLMCYAFLQISARFLKWVLVSPSSASENLITYLLSHLAADIFTPVEIILSWVMYFRILDQAPPATLTLSSSSASSKPVP